ncbi:MAG: hypothetical protein L0I24_24805, partial [Pseudonocardia sp.]|nr:hypothetical protein [Pseudonocardia sp.]
VGVALVLGAVISRADRDDPAVGAPPVFVPGPRAHDVACGCLLDPRAVGQASRAAIRSRSAVAAE